MTKNDHETMRDTWVAANLMEHAVRTSVASCDPLDQTVAPDDGTITKFDVKPYLDSPEAIKEYVAEVLRENDGDITRRALLHVAEVLCIARDNAGGAA
jgi:hypothetical protein